MELYDLQLCLKLTDMVKVKCDEAWKKAHPSSKIVLSNEIAPHVAMGSINDETYYQVWAACNNTREKIRSQHSKKMFVQSFFENLQREHEVKLKYKWLMNAGKRTYKMYIMKVHEAEKFFEKNEITSMKLGIL